jgi:hypothetical protein
VSVPLLDKKIPEGPNIRLLHCMTCSTIEELPPFEGPSEHDHLLQILVNRHQYESGQPHLGQLFVLPQFSWEQSEAREQIIKQIKGGGSEGLNEFDPQFYATRNTFAEDAMKCYNAHLRPKDGCPDYNSPSKRLLPDTKADRKEVGLVDPANAPGPKNYLCQFCPIASVVQSKINSLKGLDK